jgi:prophage regulatory protein
MKDAQNGAGLGQSGCRSIQDQYGESLVDLHAVAERLGVATRTIHRLIAAGELPPPVKVGRASRWFNSDVDRYLDRLRQARTRLLLPTLMERGAA